LPLAANSKERGPLVGNETHSATWLQFYPQEDQLR